MLRSCRSRDQQYWILLFNKPVSLLRQQSWYFRNCKSLHTKGRVGHCCTSLLIRFVVQCRIFGSHVGRGHQLIEVWLKHHVLKLRKLSFFWRVWMHFHEFCTSKNFLLHCMCVRSLSHILFVASSLCNICKRRSKIYVNNIDLYIIFHSERVHSHQVQ